MSNCSLAACAQHVIYAHPASQPSLAATARHLFGYPTPQYLNAITVTTLQALDTGAMSIFMMAGKPVKNIWPAMKQSTINLPDGSQVKSTHLCNITIPGLLIVLTGHIIPRLSIASLLGIRVLCKAGCKWCSPKIIAMLFTIPKLFYKGQKTPQPIYGRYQSMPQRT
jgi:hypothetical protein